MFRLLTILFFSFCLLTTAVAFGRSTSYFEATITHMFSSECNSHCRSKIIKNEADYATILLLKLIGTKLQKELLNVERQIYD